VGGGGGWVYYRSLARRERIRSAENGKASVHTIGPYHAAKRAGSRDNHQMMSMGGLRQSTGLMEGERNPKPERTWLDGLRKVP